MKEKVYARILQEYGAQPEHPWARSPGTAVFRHSDTGKMFAFLMRRAKEPLPPEDGEKLTFKVKDRLFAQILSGQEGYSPGGALAKGGWVSVRLDGTVSFEEICARLEESFLATASAAERNRRRPPKDWIIPANPAYYDVVGAFQKRREIAWKQGKGIKKGDTVFMYVGAPISAVLFRCLVTETGLPFRREGGRVDIHALMRIRLEQTYPPDRFSFGVLGEKYGIFAVRGPRGIPEKLGIALRENGSGAPDAAGGARKKGNVRREEHR